MMNAPHVAENPILRIKLRKRIIDRALVLYPRNPNAWRWTIQLRVYAYLLRRYDRTPALTVKYNPSEPSVTYIAGTAHGRRDPMPRSQMRELLNHIAALNDQHAVY